MDSQSNSLKHEIRSPERPLDDTMRIAYVCADPGVPVFGSKGASVHVREVLSALVRLGAKIKLFASALGGEMPLRLDNVEFCDLPNWPKGNSADGELHVEAANKMLRSMLDVAGPFDLVYERYSLWSHAAMEYASSVGVPGLLEVNAPLIEEQTRYRRLDNHEGAEREAKRVFGSARLILAVSRGVATYLARYPEASGKVHVIGNGVNAGRFPGNIKPTRPAKSGIFTVGFAGSLKPWHGLNILADAYELLSKKTSETRLLIVGDGPEREKLVNDLTIRNVLDSTEFTGMVTPSQVPGLLASMDVGVAPYPNLAGFYFSPLKVYEYMAAGLPVVASRVGDLSELIQDRVDGFLVTPGDSAGLAAALDRLRSDRDLRTRMGSAARSKVLRSHTWDIVVKRMFDLCGIPVTA